MTAAQRAVEAFVDAGHLARETGVLREAAATFADQLAAEGHHDALRELCAEFWIAYQADRTARLAHRDRWAAYETARAELDKTGQEPPPPPQPEPDPTPEPQPEPEPPKDAV